jgi:PAS domain S-box-containing protein
MKSPLRVLIVEDSETDAKLIVHTLSRARQGDDIEFARVDDEGALVSALAQHPWDLVISDWTMPRFGGRSALMIAKAAQPDVPFIIVSGTVGETSAVEAMRAGAQDYVLKGNLTRLPPAVERELRESKVRASHRRAQEALRESEMRYRVLFENSPLPKWLFDVETLQVLAVNDAAVRSYGYSREEFLTMSIKDIRPPEDLEASVREDGRLGPDSESIGVRRHRKKDGTVIDVDLSGHTFTLEGKVARLIVAQDITERRAAEEQVRLLHTIALAANEVGGLDETLEVVLRLICQAARAPLAIAWVPGPRGVPERRAVWTRPEERGRFRLFVEGRQFERGTDLPGRTWSSREPVWIPNLAEDDTFSRRLLASVLGLRTGVAVPVLAAGEAVAILEVFFDQPRERDAKLIRLFSAVGAQIGSVVERRRAEEALRKSEEQFHHAQKMEAVGQLTGGVAHDFNNLLSVILSYSVLLAEELPADDPRREDLLEIKEAGQRAASLTQQLLAFSRRLALQPRVVDLNQVMAGTEKMLRRLIGEDVELTVVLAPAAASVNVDPGQMEQVIMNLAVNARDAMPTGGQLTIEIAGVELDEAFVSEHAGSTAGPHIMLSVSDSGCGMDAATQARVFEPFFTTKERGRGTGLGLSTVFGIVRQSAGTIWLSSEKGKGTTFKIYLPVAKAAAEKVTWLPVEPARLHGSETVLVVEDEEGVRKLVRSILQRNGYRVLEAKDGADALRVAEQQPNIDLLLTDVVMPHMSGAETAMRLLAIRPGLKLLYMSGYTDNAVVLHGVLRSEAAFVQKPITPNALLAKVREVLDSSAAPAKGGAA